MAICPWQSTLWEEINQLIDRHRLPHGLLFSGMPGIGKRQFADHLAKSLLCVSKNGCSKCKSCLLFDAGSHPDYIVIEPEERGKAIKIDQIRRLNEKAVQTAQQGGHQVLVLHPADAMNPNAANALLKTLEEPPKNTFIILVANRLSAMLPTIRSRCRLVTFSAPSKEEALAYLEEHHLPTEEAKLLLKLSHNAPLTALHFHESGLLSFRKEWIESFLEFSRKKITVVALVNQWFKSDLDDLLLIFYSIIADLVRLKQLDTDEIVNLDYIETLKKITKFLDLKKLYLLLDEISQMKSLIANSTSLNVQLMLEKLSIQWRHCFI